MISIRSIRLANVWEQDVKDGSFDTKNFENLICRKKKIRKENFTIGC